MKRMPPVSVFFFLTLCKDCCKTLDGYKLHSYIADVASFHSRGWWMVSILPSWYPKKIVMTFKREVITIWFDANFLPLSLIIRARSYLEISVHQDLRYSDELWSIFSSTKLNHWIVCIGVFARMSTLLFLTVRCCFECVLLGNAICNGISSRR